MRGTVIDLGGKRAQSVVQDGRLQGEWGTKALCSHPGSGLAGLALRSTVCASEVLSASLMA